MGDVSLCDDQGSNDNTISTSMAINNSNNDNTIYLSHCVV